MQNLETIMKSCCIAREEDKGRFTRYDFVACDKLTTGLRHNLGPFYARSTFSLTKLNVQKFAPCELVNNKFVRHFEARKLHLVPYSVEICHKIRHFLSTSATIVAPHS